MNTVQSWGIAVGSALLLAPCAAPAAAAPAGWEPGETYLSESEDQFFLIERKGDLVRFRVRTAAKYYDTIKICVRKVKPAMKGKWVCRTAAMKPTGKFDVHQGKIRWQGNYPTTGDAKRRVRFGGGTKLSFNP